MNSKLDRQSPIALYAQLAAVLRSDMENGRLGAGERIESETALAQRFQVSRVTVRLALQDLADNGLLVRKQGKGTYVSRPAVQFDLQKTPGFFDILFEQGHNPRTRLLSFGPRDPILEVSRVLRLGAGEQPILLERLYLVDEKPIALGRGWLRAEASRVSWADADNHSTAWILEELLGTAVAHSEIAIRATTAGRVISRMLALPARSPILVGIRTSFDQQGRPVEFGQFFLNPDAYEFTFGSDHPIPIASTIRAVAAE
ncbi:MAG: GntR family transcriptional regulator [Hyphomicrobiales bacterium]|nr:GntR family transcriptional regulator [Hyphomicrobiales bacterium]